MNLSFSHELGTHIFCLCILCTYRCSVHRRTGACKVRGQSVEMKVQKWKGVVLREQKEYREVLRFSNKAFSFLFLRHNTNCNLSYIRQRNKELSHGHSHAKLSVPANNTAYTVIPLARNPLPCFAQSMSLMSEAFLDHQDSTLQSSWVHLCGLNSQ